MKTLNQQCPNIQHCLNIHIFFHSFGLAKAQIEILIRKSTDWFLLVSLFTTTTHKHSEIHDLILYFHF